MCCEQVWYILCYEYLLCIVSTIGGNNLVVAFIADDAPLLRECVSWHSQCWTFVCCCAERYTMRGLKRTLAARGVVHSWFPWVALSSPHFLCHMTLEFRFLFLNTTAMFLVLRIFQNVLHILSYGRPLSACGASL